MVDLILRTYNVADGTLFIDGHDVNDVAIRDVRAGCAYVPQDNFLFSDTIENNISFGTDDKSEKAIVAAAALEEGVMTGDLYSMSQLEKKEKVDTEGFLVAVNDRLKAML